MRCRSHREVGNRRFEVAVLCGLGELLAEQAQIEQGLQLLGAAEQLLHVVHDPPSQAKLLRAKARGVLIAGDVSSAHSAMTEAESLGARLGAEPESDLGRQIADLHGSLA